MDIKNSLNISKSKKHHFLICYKFDMIKLVNKISTMRGEYIWQKIKKLLLPF